MGAGEYAMRIWLDPQALQSLNLEPKDVIDAVQQQSQEVTAGQVGMPPAPKDQQFQYTVDVLSRFNDPGQFSEIVVKDQTAQGGRIVRIKDVGRIEMGAQTYSQDFKLNGKTAAGIAIYQTPDANSLDVAKVVAAKMQELSQRFRQGWHTAFPTIRRFSSRTRSTKSTRRCGRPECWSSLSSSCSCRIFARRWCRRRRFRSR